ncbi:MFS transporter [Dactylosporangium sp. NPDC005572]|uniref:MFS transporter n=1 Tax=Dactylosporangium sp. NPDC005572 TaxID=3156889 RepID=UPI0033A22BB5
MDDSPALPRAWRVGVIAGMASYLDAAAIVSTSVALVLYQHALGLTASQVGLLAGTLAFSIAAGSLSGGRLGDVLGRRVVFTATVGLVAAAAGLLAMATSLPLLLAGVTLMGLGIGADLPASLATITELSGDGRRGAMIGLSSVLWLAGILATKIIAAVAGDLGRTGGQVLFAHIAVVAVAVMLSRLTLPESPSWMRSHQQQRVDARTLLQAPYRRPFLALVAFYALTNLFANTFGQFGTYVAVNVAGLTVRTSVLMTLPVLPIGIALGLWFMRVADSPARMRYFAIGGALLVAGPLVPALSGFTVTSPAATGVLVAAGSSLAFEPIMKVWTQESFPTLLRSSAQGIVIAVGRCAAAGFALVTPGLLERAPRGLYTGLGIAVTLGLVTAWSTFRRPDGALQPAAATSAIR